MSLENALQFLPQAVISGLEAGVLYALPALAFILIYRASDVMNFAQGEMAMFSTFVALAILNHLREENVFAACVLHAVAGFLGRQRVKTSHLVDAGGKLPVIIVFVDTDEHVNRVLPKLKEMAAHRLIVRENVVLEQGNLE